MYCTKCGKKINYDSHICVECITAMAEEARSAQEEKSISKIDDACDNFESVTTPDETCCLSEVEKIEVNNEQSPRKAGLKKAIWSPASCAISYMIYIYGLFLIEDIPLLSLIFIGISLIGTVISFVLGLASIKVFNKARAEGRPAPIATLILAIFGVVFVGLMSILYTTALMTYLSMLV